MQRIEIVFNINSSLKWIPTLDGRSFDRTMKTFQIKTL